MIGIVIAKARIFPTEISALGVKFSQGDSESILNVLSWIIIYYLITYVVYSFSELLSLRAWSLEKEEEYRKELERHSGSGERYSIGMYGATAVRVRSYFEFFIPIIIASISVAWLWVSEPPPIKQVALTNNTEQNIKWDRFLRRRSLSLALCEIGTTYVGS